jgi:hypothetical protein
MAAIYSNGDNRWNILGFNFPKRDALSSVYKISMISTELDDWFKHLLLSPSTGLHKHEQKDKLEGVPGRVLIDNDII